MTRVICLYEDRPDHAVGLQLAIASLARHAPKFHVLVHCPRLEPLLRSWILDQGNATLIRLDVPASSGWNVKPTVLQSLLADHSDITWVDSDILLTAPVDRVFDALPDDLLLATEEPYWGQLQGGDLRTKSWGLEPGRVFRSTINSGIVRVTARHKPVLDAWQQLLAHPKYLLAQSRPWYERPMHMVGDQEVLTALLGAADFADVPVKLLERGKDIAQCFGPAGFTPLERIRSVARGMPPFVHAMGPKPWLRALPADPKLGAVESGTAWYRYLSAELSPYTVAARRYRDVEGIDLRWTQPESGVGKVLSFLGRSGAAATGLPLALVDHAARAARRALKISRFGTDPDFVIREHPFSPPMAVPDSGDAHSATVRQLQAGNRSDLQAVP